MNNIFINKIKQFLQNKKIKLIYKLGYQFFYDAFELNLSGVYIPAFLQQEQRKNYAHIKTKECIKEIIKNNALDRCYKSARAYEKSYF